MKVRAILAAKGRDVVTIEPEARVLDAANLMRRVDIGAVLVVDGRGTMLGILTEREIARGLATCSFRLPDMRSDHRLSNSSGVIPSPSVKLAAWGRPSRRRRIVASERSRSSLSIVSMYDQDRTWSS